LFLKLIVFSDSHGQTGDMAKALNLHEDAGMVIHLGDFVNDIVRLSNSIQMKTDIAYEYVAGNGDYFSGYDITQKTLTLGRKKLFLTHGHLYRPRLLDYSLLYEYGREQKCDAFLFGHTHIPYAEQHYGCLFLNPGSISYPRSSTGKTYMTVEIDDGGGGDIRYSIERL
jgi:putative phosphoesterase